MGSPKGFAVQRNVLVVNDTIEPALSHPDNPDHIGNEGHDEPSRFGQRRAGADCTSSIREMLHKPERQYDVVARFHVFRRIEHIRLNDLSLTVGSTQKFASAGATDRGVIKAGDRKCVYFCKIRQPFGLRTAYFNELSILH